MDAELDDDLDDVPQPSHTRRWWVKKFILQFFEDKFSCLPDAEGNPQPIPEGTLLSDFNVSLVGSELEVDGSPVPVYNLIYAYDLIEAAIRRHRRNGRHLMYHQVTNKKELVEYQLWLLHECERRRIPKEFRGGIILLYTWLCEGVPFDAAPPREGYEAKTSPPP